MNLKLFHQSFGGFPPTAETMRRKMKLHCQVQGSGYPVVILHGLFGSLENWAYAHRALADKCKVILPDLRNHGASPHSEEMTYASMAGDIKELLEEQNIQRTDLLGHSLGGKVAMQFAFAYPEKVRKLVVVDIAARSYPPCHEMILKAMLGLCPSRFSHRQEMEEYLAPAVPDVATRRFLLKNVVRDTQGCFQWRLGLRELERNYDHLAAAVEVAQDSKTPALLIRGGTSDYVTDADSAQFLRQFPQGRVEVIPGAGHWVHAEAKEVFWEVVSKFLLGES